MFSNIFIDLSRSNLLIHISFTVNVLFQVFLKTIDESRSRKNQAGILIAPWWMAVVKSHLPGTLMLSAAIHLAVWSVLARVTVQLCGLSHPLSLVFFFAYTTQTVSMVTDCLKDCKLWFPTM